MRTPSLRARLTLWYTFALVVVLCLFGANVVWTQGRLGVRRVDRELDGLTATLSNIVRDELKEMATPVAAAEEACQTLAASGRPVAIFDEHGTPLAAEWHGLELHEPLPSSRAGRTVWMAKTPAGAWRVHAQPVTFGPAALV